MKKVFLSLAFIAVLTVVSCKKADAAAEEVVAADTTAVVEVDTMAVDSMAAPVDSMAVEAPAAE
jgi:PBP1b-binding outer membrane lipoprotein LpoB